MAKKKTTKKKARRKKTAADYGYRSIMLPEKAHKLAERHARALSRLTGINVSKPKAILEALLEVTSHAKK